MRGPGPAQLRLVIEFALLLMALSAPGLVCWGPAKGQQALPPEGLRGSRRLRTAMQGSPAQGAGASRPQRPSESLRPVEKGERPVSNSSLWPRAG